MHNSRNVFFNARRKPMHVLTLMVSMFILAWIIAGCSRAGPAAHRTATLQKLPTPQVYKTQSPDPSRVLEGYFAAWTQGDYEALYAFLDESSKARISESEFVNLYTEFAAEVALAELQYHLIDLERHPQRSNARVEVSYASAIIGTFKREIEMPFVNEGGSWKVVWDTSLMMPELTDGNYVRMDREIPARKSIFDRFGNPLAAQKNSIAIGIWPDYIDLEDDGGLLGLLAKLTGIKAITLQGMVETAEPGAYLPVAEIPADSDPERIEILKTYGAVVTSEYSSRLYYGNGIAPHVVGYVSAIQKEELNEY